MKTTLLTQSDQKEALSHVYVRSLAAISGFVTSVPEQDRDSVDLRIQAGGPRRPALDLQLKATTKLSANQQGTLNFRISVKNYRDLSGKTQTPRLLVVLKVPEESSKWLRVTPEKLILHGHAYWLSLQKGYEDVAGQDTITVHIPQKNVLNVETLKSLIEQSRTGTI